MFEGDTMLHNVPLLAHLAKVIVEKFCDGSALVYVPIDEVTIIVQTLQTFIDWPKHLVSPISDTT
ncbi:unnamed protein product, partial [Sphenostylis stenocarpa]